jgi:predicted component of type VI protein secretion system
MARPREESLRELLSRVHERLSGAASVDSETRRMLATLTRDIERTLGGASGKAGGPERPRGHRESVSRLEELAARFDADHPALAQTLRQLVDFLGKGGV